MNWTRTKDWSASRRILVAIVAALTAVAIAILSLVACFAARSESVQPFSAALKAGWVVRAADVTPENTSVVVRPDANGIVVIQSPHLTLSADRTCSPYLAFSSPAASLRITLAWRRAADTAAYDVTHTFEKTAPSSPAASYEITFPDLPLHPAWKGHIEFIAWRIQAGSDPLTLTAVSPARTTSLIDDVLWPQWWSFQPIDAVNINSIRAPHVLGVGPVVSLALGCVFTISLYVAYASLRRRTLRAEPIVLVVTLAWLANDLRWIAAQQHQLDRDRAAFTSSVSPDAPASVWPPEVAEMARAARDVLPEGAIYAVAGGNLNAAAADSRLRYLLSPRWIQINVDPLQPAVAPERVQYVLVLTFHAAEYDLQTGMLFAQGLPPIHAELVKQIKSGGYIMRRAPDGNS